MTEPSNFLLSCQLSSFLAAYLNCFCCCGKARYKQVPAPVWKAQDTLHRYQTRRREILTCVWNSLRINESSPQEQRTKIANRKRLFPVCCWATTDYVPDWAKATERFSKTVHCSGGRERDNIYARDRILEVTAPMTCASLPVPQDRQSNSKEQDNGDSKAQENAQWSEPVHIWLWKQDLTAWSEKDACNAKNVYNTGKTLNCMNNVSCSERLWTWSEQSCFAFQYFWQEMSVFRWRLWRSIARSVLTQTDFKLHSTP